MIFREALIQAMKENDLFVFHKLLQDTPHDQKDIFLNFDILQKALWWTVQRGHAHLVRELLTIPCVAQNAHSENNRALCHAIDSRQTNTRESESDAPR